MSKVISCVHGRNFCLECHTTSAERCLQTKLDAALARESALREKLETRTADLLECGTKRKALQQRLTDAEQRAGKFEGLLLQTNELLYQIQGDPGLVPSSSIDAMRGEVFTALKPAEGEGS